MNAAIIYIHPRPDMRKYIPAARRFAASYIQHPPGATQHDVYVVVNGDIVRKYDEKPFHPLPVKLITHDNFGKDIGAFQKCAREIKGYDLMVFCGAEVRFRRAGWLDLMMMAYEKKGPGIFGAFAFHQPALHIRTTCFWMPPELLNLYPYQIGNEHRYDFEHGANSIAKWTIDSGFNAWMVTWLGIYPPAEWRHVENHEAVVLDQHTARIGYQ